MKIIDKLIGTLRALGTSESDERLLEELTSEDKTPIDLAYAVLLVDLSLIDGRFDQREYEFVVNLLKKDLKINDDQAVTLIKSASSYLAVRGSHSFAVEIQKRLPLERRKEIADELLKLIKADSVEDGFEVYLQKKLADVLGV